MYVKTSVTHIINITILLVLLNTRIHDVDHMLCLNESRDVSC